MAGKTFKKGIDTLLGEIESKESVKASMDASFALNNNLEIPTTYLIKKRTAENIRKLAYWERLKLKDVVGKAFDEFITNYENKNGPLKEIPK